jgi:plastocyanin
MSTSLAATHTPTLRLQPSLRTITVAALVANALLFGFDALSRGADEINITHIIVSLVLAGIAALRFRWTPAIGVFAGAAQLLEGYVFLGSALTQPGSVVEFAIAVVFFAISLVALVAGVGALVQNYRAPRSRPFVAPPAPRWAIPAVFALSALVVGSILTTAIQSGGASPGFSPEAVARLPALTAKDFKFAQQTITAKVGETVALRLENGDTSTHHFDLDEFNVHAVMPVGQTNVALFKPTQPGTYTFYCQPHADKAAGTGMVGALVVEP